MVNLFYCRVRFIFRYFLFHLMNKMGYIDQVARFLEAVTQDAYYKCRLCVLAFARLLNQ